MSRLQLNVAMAAAAAVHSVAADYEMATAEQLVDMHRRVIELEMAMSYVHRELQMMKCQCARLKDA